jgi:hypothetical protein
VTRTRKELSRRGEIIALDEFRIDRKVALISDGNRSICLGIARLFGEAGVVLLVDGGGTTR